MVLRDFFLGFIRVHILYHASLGPVYGQALIRELSRHGYEISPGTIYPILHSLERQGLLKSQVSGRGQLRHYCITEPGLALLAEARGKIKELIDEVM